MRQQDPKSQEWIVMLSRALQKEFLSMNYCAMSRHASIQLATDFVIGFSFVVLEARNGILLTKNHFCILT